MPSSFKAGFVDFNMSKVRIVRIGEREREVCDAACLSNAPPPPPPPPHPPGNSASANQQLTFAGTLVCLVYVINFFVKISWSLYSVVVRVEDSDPKERGFASRNQQVLFSAFERGEGGGWLAGRYKRRRPGLAGRYKIFLMLGGGGQTCLSARSGRDTLEYLNLQYVRDTISLSTILFITRRTFYFVSIEYQLSLGPFMFMD